MNYTIYDSSIFNDIWNTIQSSAVSLLFFWIIFNVVAFATMYYLFKNNKKIKSVHFNNFLNTSIMTALASELFEAVKIHLVFNTKREIDCNDLDDSYYWLLIKRFSKFENVFLLCKLREIFNGKIYFKFKLA